MTADLIENTTSRSVNSAVDPRQRNRSRALVLVGGQSESGGKPKAVHR